MKLNKLTSVIIATSALMLGAHTVMAAEVEVLHYWTSAGEAKSVAELKKMLESKGDCSGRFSDDQPGIEFLLEVRTL